MKYAILKVRQLEDIIETVVEYDFDGKISTVTIHHFQPQTKQDVLTGIENRFVSEERKMTATETIEGIVAELAADVRA